MSLFDVDVSKLCGPVKAYLLISAITFYVVLVQSYAVPNTLCLGSYSCSVDSINIILFLKLIYVAFWAWILNLICNAGATPVAWFLVLVPYLLFFIAVAGLMIR